jgi:hypothetical protein
MDNNTLMNNLMIYLFPESYLIIKYITHKKYRNTPFLLFFGLASIILLMGILYHIILPQKINNEIFFLSSLFFLVRISCTIFAYLIHNTTLKNNPELIFEGARKVYNENRFNKMVKTILIPEYICFKKIKNYKSVDIYFTILLLNILSKISLICAILELSSHFNIIMIALGGSLWLLCNFGVNSFIYLIEDNSHYKIIKSLNKKFIPNN